MLRAIPCEATKASSCSFPAFSQVGKEEPWSRGALQLDMGRQHSGRARGSGGGAGGASQGQATRQQEEQQSWFLMEVPLLGALSS